MGQEGGARALWTGASSTVVRAMLLNGGQLGVYSEAKAKLGRLAPWLNGSLNGLPLQFVSSLISATAAVLMSSPADVVKSRLQNAPKGRYAGMAACGAQMLHSEVRKRSRS